jgi:hypothetical protein
MEVSPVKQSELFRMLDADEAAEVAPLPASDAETPTTSLSTSTSQSTASVHFPGNAPAAQSDIRGVGETHADADADPVAVREEK